MRLASHWQALFEQDISFAFFNTLKERHVEEAWSTGHFCVLGICKCNISSTTCQIFSPFSQPDHPHWGKEFVIHIIDMRSLTRKPWMILHVCLTSFLSCHFHINIGVWKHTLVFCEERHVVFCFVEKSPPCNRKGRKQKLKTPERSCDCRWLTSMRE